MYKTAENELSFSEDAQHIHVTLHILVMEVSSYAAK
jgi:hypothetical protein